MRQRTASQHRRRGRWWRWRPYQSTLREPVFEHFELKFLFADLVRAQHLKHLHCHASQLKRLKGKHRIPRRCRGRRQQRRSAAAAAGGGRRGDGGGEGEVQIHGRQRHHGRRNGWGRELQAEAGSEAHSQELGGLAAEFPAKSLRHQGDGAATAAAAFHKGLHLVDEIVVRLFHDEVKGDGVQDLPLARQNVLRERLVLGRPPRQRNVVGLEAVPQFVAVLHQWLQVPRVRGVALFHLGGEEEARHGHVEALVPPEAVAGEKVVEENLRRGLGLPVDADFFRQVFHEDDRLAPVPPFFLLGHLVLSRRRVPQSLHWQNPRRPVSVAIFVFLFHDFRWSSSRRGRGSWCGNGGGRGLGRGRAAGGNRGRGRFLRRGRRRWRRRARSADSFTWSG
mmetsp:Transcript_36478/g.74117  ORF Transcript_36478/g.74117 Transcript_36478/m.74117 type:complete len:393 (+) Transcript_36478:159-1337(+)